MQVTRMRALLVAVLVLTGCEEKPPAGGTSSATASVVTAPTPPRATAPTPVPTSPGPEPKPPREPKLDEAKGPGSVTFGFAPKLDEPFTIETVRVKQKRRGSGKFGAREVLRTVEKVTVATDGEGYTWRTAPVSFSVHGERTSRVDELVAGFEMTYRLDPKGAVTKVEGYEGLDEKANEMLGPKTLKRMGPMLTAESLRRTRETEWRGRVGDLVGQTASLDEPHISVAELPLPKGSATVYGVHRFGPWLDCPSLGRCLRVETYQHTSPEALAALAKLPVETIKAVHDNDDDRGHEGHDHPPGSPKGAPDGHGHDHAGKGSGGPPGGPPIAMGVHIVRIVDPESGLPVWERIEREIDLGLAQLSDATTSSYQYAESAK